jgi:hypothetical protein
MVRLSLSSGSSAVKIFGRDNPLLQVDQVQLQRNVTSIKNRGVGTGKPYRQTTDIEYDVTFTGGMTGPGFAYMMAAADKVYRNSGVMPRLSATVEGTPAPDNQIITGFVINLTDGDLGAGRVTIGAGDAAATNEVTITFSKMEADDH